ncbi:lysophospholipid acyltransferase family protein [Amylibacter sp. IMCC11727]|nr:lysophospholipid acyltransferase family protein [Amylibacter sp. IMCC11727]WGI23594.1 lysophospholipid acyltransferase family protein [Amylibacter sp. IMCC11727]
MIRTTLWLAKLVPFRVRGSIMAAVGGTLVRYVPSFRKRAEAGLTKVFPNMPTSERLALVRAVGRNIARTMTELLFNAEFSKVAEQLPVHGPGLAVVKAAQADGRGALIVSGHYGQWEAIRHAFRTQGIEVGAVYRPNNNPYYEPLFVKNVEIGGKPLAPKGTAGTKVMVRHLRKGGVMAILTDQKYGQGPTLDFLGHPASTTTAPAELALKYDLPLIPAYGIRTKDGLRIETEAPIPSSDANTMMQAVNDSLAARVLADPTQWHWLHQRWELNKSD